MISEVQFVFLLMGSMVVFGQIPCNGEQSALESVRENLKTHWCLAGDKVSSKPGRVYHTEVYHTGVNYQLVKTMKLITF